MAFIYLMIGLLATTVGAIAGLGGGVIIKPVLDAFGHYDIATIGVLSSSTVFAMSIVSLGKKIKAGIKLDGKRTFSIAIGATIGGIIGKQLFQSFMKMLNNESAAKTIQAIILTVLMLIVFILVNNKDKIKTKNIKSLIVCFFVGIILGTISSFLGIGGGPINVAILALLFSMNAKEAAIHSIFIIFFAQLSKLVNISLTSGFAAYNLEMLYYMILGGIGGGILGATLSKKMSNEHINKLFNIVLIIIICINIYNIF